MMTQESSQCGITVMSATAPSHLVRVSANVSFSALITSCADRAVIESLLAPENQETRKRKHGDGDGVVPQGEARPAGDTVRSRLGPPKPRISDTPGYPYPVRTASNSRVNKQAGRKKSVKDMAPKEATRSSVRLRNAAASKVAAPVNAEAGPSKVPRGEDEMDDVRSKSLALPIHPSSFLIVHRSRTHQGRNANGAEKSKFVGWDHFPAERR